MSCSGRKLNKLSKTSNKIAKKSKRSFSKKTQRGGVSNACVLDYTNDKAIYNGASEANAHNLNPQASLDLDNKFMNYGGSIPLGQSGGSNCGDDGVGTSRPKTETFKQYLKNLDADLTFKGGSSCGSHRDKQNGGSSCGSHRDKQNGGSSCGSHRDKQNGGSSCGSHHVKQNGGSSCGSHHVKQNGAGYIVDTSQYIGGQPVYKAYDDNAPPAIIGGQIVSGHPDQAVCGNGALTGGSKKMRRKNKSKTSKSKKSKKSNKSKKSKKSKKSNSKKSKKSKKSKSQRGGDFVAIGSKPADFSTAFDGPKGVFNYPDDMMSREFGEKQPNYSVNAI